MGRTGLLCSVLLLVGCGPREIRVTMNSDNNSGQKGFATITDMGKSITVVVDTSAPDVVGSQLAHIHAGNCGEVEDIYAPLLPLTELAGKPGRVGSTSTEIRSRVENKIVQFDDFAKGEWLINIHDSRDKDIYVSCGEFATK